MLLEMKEPTQALQQFEATLAKEPGRFHALYGAARARPPQRSDMVRTGLIDPYPARQAASIVALAAFNVARVSRAILPFAIKLRSLAFRVVVE